MTQSRFNDESTAKIYQDLLLPLIFEPWGRLLIGKAGLKTGDQVLDVATGPGTLARMAAQTLGPKGGVVGIDNSPQMLAQAKAAPPVVNGAKLDFVEASAQSLPFPDQQFDKVFCQQGIQFFSDQLGVLKEMKRVLKPGGCLALALWSDGRAMSLFAAIHEALEAAMPDQPRRPPPNWLNPSNLRDLFVGAGFANPIITEETLTVVLDRGFPQALECAIGTTSGPAIRALSKSDRASFEEKLFKNLSPWLKGQVVFAPARALVAVAIN